MTTKEQAVESGRDPLSLPAAALFDRAELRPGDRTGYLHQQSVYQHRLFAYRNSCGVNGYCIVALVESSSMTSQILAAELGNLISDSKRKNTELRNAAEKALQDLKSLSNTSESQVSAGKSDPIEAVCSSVS